MKLVSIIIPNYNGIQHLKNYLCSVVNTNYLNFEIIIVDNGSNDGSTEFIENKYPKIKIIKNVRNFGFAHACNVGYCNSIGYYILFLNNDVAVEPNFLTILVKEIEKEKNIGAVQPKIARIQDSSKLDCVGAFLTSTGFLYHFGYGKNTYDCKYNEKIPIFSMKGAAMLFKREALEKAGVFDEKFFSYFEETDLCHRLWLAGYKIFYIPQSVVYHKGGGTSSRMDNNIIQYHSFKNRINSYIKNLGVFELLKILPFHLLICLFISVVFPKYFKLIHRAIIWNIINLKSTIIKRKNVQTKIRIVDDKILMAFLKRKVKLSYYYYLFKDLEKYED